MLVEGVKIALAMAQTEAFNRLGTKFWDEVPIPGCEHTDLWSDEYWTCMCRQYTTTIYHHSGIYIAETFLCPSYRQKLSKLIPNKNSRVRSVRSKIF